MDAWKEMLAVLGGVALIVAACSIPGGSKFTTVRMQCIATLKDKPAEQIERICGPR